MKIFNWDNKKNERLKFERGISFEEVVFCIENGQILNVLEHPKKKKYKGQRMYVVAINNYAYIVPFIDSENERFLKIKFPSRKYTKLYLNKEK